MPDEKQRDEGMMHGGTGVYDFYQQDDSRLLGWLHEAIIEGQAINQNDPAYDSIDEMMDFVEGKQHTGDSPSWIHRVVVNQFRKVLRTHVSALTDVNPLFGWKTGNPKFSMTADQLNSLTVIWWINTFADLEIADCVRYSLLAGAGDLVIEYDKFYQGGDTRIISRDPRDTLPIRPSRDRSIQNWVGVTLREAHSVNKLRAYFPGNDGIIVPDTGIFPQAVSRFRQRKRGITTPVRTLDGLTNSRTPTPGRDLGYECTLYRTFINDLSMNTGGSPVLMGKPGTAWSYTVEPGARLYPNKRLVLWTAQGILYDGASPFGHGMFPVSRLKLEPWPWLFLGMPLLLDLKTGQTALNHLVNGMLQNIDQHIKQGSVWDKNMPEGVVKRFDPREPYWKVKKNAMMGDGMKLADVSELPSWAPAFLTSMFAKFDELSEVANLQAFLNLRQAPGADTIQKFMDALTPGIRLEARQLEAFLRDVATMWKGNTFQFQSTARRFQLLGDTAKLVEDVDYDPDSMVPAMNKSEAGYIPELDIARPWFERAQFMSNQFSFRVEPNSLLATASAERKLLALQLSRQGYLDFWTLMTDILGYPNVGDPPAMPLPIIGDVPEGTSPAVDPVTGQPLPILSLRTPRTITERLMAQQQLGIGQTVSPAGRKASGQEAPHLEVKDGGTRATVAES